MPVQCILKWTSFAHLPEFMNLYLCYCAQFQKNPYPPHGRSLEIPRGKGEGVLKVKILEVKYNKYNV